MNHNIAIDGPAGAGKSTIAKKVARARNAIYVDTGAMYRAVAVHMLRTHIDITDENAVAEAAEQTDISIRYEYGEQHVLLNGEDVTEHLREEDVTAIASAVSANARLRAHLVRLQQKIAAENDVVMDGRDIGTVVLPDAFLKIYLTASSLTRAKRRFLQDEEKAPRNLSPVEEAAEIERIRIAIEERDKRDMTREASPLRQAEDAVLLDSSDLTREEVVEHILLLAENRSAAH